MTASKQIEISLVGMRFHVCVGILPRERDLSQPLLVDLIVRHNADAQSVLDYRALYDLTAETIDTDELTYLEPIAESLAARALALDNVTWCRVAIRKPHVALGGPLEYAQVAIERERA
jgi:dihydroneopterin aldolase